MTSFGAELTPTVFGQQLDALVAGVAGRAALAAIAAPVVGQTVAFDGSVWEVQTRAANPGWASDIQQGLFVASSTDATLVWVRKFSGYADFRWFGGVADMTANGVGTDNTPMFNAARAALIAAGRGWLHFPQQPAAYRFATAPSAIHDGILITGDNYYENPGVVGGTTYVGIQTYQGTVLGFAADVPGFKFIPFTDNPSNATAFEFFGANDSTIRDLVMYSEGGVGTTGHGIESFARCNLINLQIVGFAGSGVKLSGDDSGTTDQYGNPIQSRIESVRCISNKLHGFHVTGNNGNVISFSNCLAQVNGGVGFLNQGFLGCSHVNCQAATNNQSHPSNNGSAFSTAQRTQNTTDWAGLSDAGAGSFVTSSGVGAHVFVGCYVENGEGATHEIVFPASVVGGRLASTAMTATAAAAPASILSASTLSGVSAIKSDGLGSLTTSNIIVSPTSGNASLKVSGSTVFAGLQLYPNNVQADGLDILANAAAAYFSVDSLIIRNAAQSVTYGTWSSTGLNLGSGKVLQVNGTQVVGARQTGTAANATDLTTAVALVNDLKAKLIAHGLIS